eukprot:1406239-Rhodomonas_salina.1
MTCHFCRTENTPRFPSQHANNHRDSLASAGKKPGHQQGQGCGVRSSGCVAAHANVRRRHEA